VTTRKRRRSYVRTDISRLWGKLRRADPPDRMADVIIVIRVRLNEETGEFESSWDSANWFKFNPGEEPPPGCLPAGVAEYLAKVFAYRTAQSIGGDMFATLGAGFGRHAVQSAGKMLQHMLNREDDDDG
jgi:hypothetical protein